MRSPPPPLPSAARAMQIDVGGRQSVTFPSRDSPLLQELKRKQYIAAMDGYSLGSTPSAVSRNIGAELQAALINRPPRRSAGGCRSQRNVARVVLSVLAIAATATALAIAVQSRQGGGAVPAGTPPAAAAEDAYTANYSIGCSKGGSIATNRSVAIGPVQMTTQHNGVPRTYWLYVPSAPANATTVGPLPLLLNFHGWTWSGEDHMKNLNGNTVAQAKQFIHVYPDGMADNPNPSPFGSWGSWNAAGTGSSPGPAGATCTNGDTSLCYSSCAARKPNGTGCDPAGCDWTTCADDTGFVEKLLDELEATLCVDPDRIYAAGFSNGGILAYELAMTLAPRLAAVASVAGGVHPGFMSMPAGYMPLLDIHGLGDTTIPINATTNSTVAVSEDLWEYIPGPELFEGFRAANDCVGKAEHTVTPYDGTAGLYCMREGVCGGARDHAAGSDRSEGAATAAGQLGPEGLVRCTWDGGHHVPGANMDPLQDVQNVNWGMEFIWSWLSQHRNTRPAGSSEPTGDADHGWDGEHAGAILHSLPRAD